MQENELAHLISSRICHDLVSPVGAIVNGVDLMQEMGGSEAEELTMIGQSAARASAVLQLMRLAFGRASTGGDGIARGSLRDRIDPAVASPRVEVSWSGLEGPGLPQDAARLVAVMALCARGTLGMSGHVRILLAPSAGLPAGALAEGPAATLNPDQARWIAEGAQAMPLPEPRQVEFALLKGVAAAAGASISTGTDTGKVTFAARPAD